MGFGAIHQKLQLCRQGGSRAHHQCTAYPRATDTEYALEHWKIFTSIDRLGHALHQAEQDAPLLVHASPDSFCHALDRDPVGPTAAAAADAVATAYAIDL